MRTEPRLRAEVDVCPACGGLWLDAGETEPATGRPMPPPVPQQPSDRSCPVCRTTLRVAALGRVTVDWCDACRGMYLDPGELETIRSMRVHVPREEDREATRDGAAAGGEVAWGVLEFLGSLLT
jgi:Zn-finger nucleic acid-binding protein